MQRRQSLQLRIESQESGIKDRCNRVGRLTNFLILGEDLLQLLPHLSLGQLHVVFDVAGFHVREHEVAGVAIDFELEELCQRR